jgi:hypothetical protein
MVRITGGRLSVMGDWVCNYLKNFNSYKIFYTSMHLTPQESPLPGKTMPQFAEAVIPDESA